MDQITSETASAVPVVEAAGEQAATPITTTTNQPFTPEPWTPTDILIRKAPSRARMDFITRQIVTDPLRLERDTDGAVYIAVRQIDHTTLYLANIRTEDEAKAALASMLDVGQIVRGDDEQVIGFRWDHDDLSRMTAAVYDGENSEGLPIRRMIHLRQKTKYADDMSENQPPRLQTPSHGFICIYRHGWARNRLRRLPLHVAAVILNNCRSISGLGPPPYDFRFLRTFLSPHNSYYRTPDVYMSIGHRGDDPYDIWLSYHMRHLSRDPEITSSYLLRISSSSESGLSISRSRAKISDDPTTQVKLLKDGVLSFSASLLVVPKGNSSEVYYSVTAMVDEVHGMATHAFDHSGEGTIPDEHKWEQHGFEPCGKCTAVSQFLLVALMHFELWEQGWMGALDEIDKSVGFQLDDTLDRQRLDRFMFDESFERSRLYFALLQILRTSSNRLEETLRDWSTLRQVWNNKLLRITVSAPPFSPEDLKALGRNWDRATEALEAASQRIEARISRKSEEIKSLRDGLFNATSLREATKGMALNRAIYVFTIVTVIYTPIGFLATFWALPFLQKSTATEPSSTSSPNSSHDSTSSSTLVPTGFTASFIAIPIVTYVASVLGALSLGYSAGERRALKKRLLDRWKALLEFIASLNPWSGCRDFVIFVGRMLKVLCGIPRALAKRVAKRKVRQLP
ncbi:hypothetical protein QBC35DRAFT_254523 [Podospora australis]|uniref:Uncharacterized protein n=1 Tax=Podospora australis TaxID=1536484 RepID=A0AAN6WR53_9PEZI|nr:hypothetical protein QBC35DRAFT_254523 [Podospora australis]